MANHLDTSANADLHARAQLVTMLTSYEAQVGLSARQVARCMSGVVALIARQVGAYAMQRACAELVRDPRAWATGLCELPRRPDGQVDLSIDQLAAVARGLLAVCSEDTMKSALAFWAIESDPAVWQRVAA